MYELFQFWTLAERAAYAAKILFDLRTCDAFHAHKVFPVVPNINTNNMLQIAQQ